MMYKDDVSVMSGKLTASSSVSEVREWWNLNTNNGYIYLNLEASHLKSGIDMS